MILAVLVANLVALTLYFIIAPMLLRKAHVPWSAGFNALMVGFMVVSMITTGGAYVVVALLVG